MDSWGTLDIASAIVRDDLNNSFRRAKKTVSGVVVELIDKKVHAFYINYNNPKILR